MFRPFPLPSSSRALGMITYHNFSNLGVGVHEGLLEHLAVCQHENINEDDGSTKYLVTNIFMLLGESVGTHGCDVFW